MARVTPQEYAEKWARRTSQATDDYRKGIERVTEAPGPKAAAAADLWAERTAAGKSKFAANVGAVDLTKWKGRAMSKGVQRIAQGVEEARPDMAQIGQQLLANVDSAKQAIANMPKGNLEARIARSAAFQREMAKRPIRR